MIQAAVQLGVGLFFLWGSVFSTSAFASSPDQNNRTEPLSQIKIVSGVVKSGDTTSSILDPYLPLKTIYEISSRKIDDFSFARIRKGQPYRVILNKKELIRFEYEIDAADRFVIEKKQDRFSVYREAIEYDVNIETVSGVITSNLFYAVRKAGEKQELADRLSDIFAWDIDFLRDIQPGDRFKVLVEKRYRNGRLVGYGQIKAAFFVNRASVYKAFLYTDINGHSGYYDEHGNSLQKAFLKAPLSFSRISSRFTYRRMHPIFKEYRPHPGVDYAAPKGTPVRTVGDGIVSRIGWNKGMGNFVEVRHYNGYTTSYNHMNNFAKGIKKNKKILQGDVIGYVGMTGYATGPHLDFRMKKNGNLIDPLKYRIPSEKPVNPDEMNRFLAQTRKLSEMILASHELALTDRPST